MGRKKKKSNLTQLIDQLNWLCTNLEHSFNDTNSRDRFTAAAGPRIKELGCHVLGLTSAQLDVFEQEGLVNLSEEFFQAARQFDPNISTEDIFQASRNVWTACYLQLLLGLKAKLTPAIFAYSMLYPVTDNFLDDPKRSKLEKLEFNQHFQAWLKGEKIKPINVHENAVLRLIQMIEAQYARNQYVQVYESLLAIFDAQLESMLMPNFPVHPYSVDVLGITLRKGGTSVLADGVLAAGELTVDQMKTIFNYGCFAQFMDDQEDVTEDLRNRQLTVFTEAARTGKLDDTMNRLFAYSKNIVKGLDLFISERTAPLIQVSLKGIDLLLIEACVRNQSFYSRFYLAYLEVFFPVSFASLKKLRNQVRRRNLSIERLVETFWPNKPETPSPVFQGVSSQILLV